MRIMNSVFDYNRAIKDEIYAANIKINERLDYDDFIFVLSAFYASGINLSKIADVIEKDPKCGTTNVNDASFIHCLPGKEAVEEIISFLNIDNIHKIKSMRESRDGVKKNITPYLLKQFQDYNKITITDVVVSLRQ